MKKIIFSIVVCLFTATLSGCLYIEPGYSNGYANSYYSNNEAVAAARFSALNDLRYAANQGFYTPAVFPVQTFTARRADPCDGLTPWQCTGININKNVPDGRASIGINPNHHNNNFRGDDHNRGGNGNNNGDDHNRRRRGR